MNRRDKKVIIAYVVRPGRLGNYVVKVGERISLNPAHAKQLIAQGVVEQVTEPISSVAVAEAGGVDAYLAKDAKVRVLSKVESNKLEARLYPWEHKPFPLAEQP